MNPCIDCHALMLKKAGQKMEELKADFIFTGEVLGQRPMSQTKQSLHIVSKLSGYEGYILRPMSARLLPETIPERENKVDRERLSDIQGRGRKRQIQMAAQYGITGYSSPGGGCLLTDSIFSRKLKDLFHHHADFKIRDLELLKSGRHLRLDEKTKIIVGRHKKDNDAIGNLVEHDDIVIKMRDFPGPLTLVPTGCNEENMRKAASICAMYSDAPANEPTVAQCSTMNTIRLIEVTAEKTETVQALMI
jgi:tRNA U34 2-thiouridine synthase MnmA/TrmU